MVATATSPRMRGDDALGAATQAQVQQDGVHPGDAVPGHADQQEHRGPGLGQPGEGGRPAAPAVLAGPGREPPSLIVKGEEARWTMRYGRSRVLIARRSSMAL